MNDEQAQIAEACLRGAEDNAMTFPEIVGALSTAGFESYAIDFRRATATYYRPDGESVVLSTHRPGAPVAESFDSQALRAAIREAQALVEGYTYRGFCEKAAAAGCAGYLVSFTGRRALYVGRTAEIHVEFFPR